MFTTLRTTVRKHPDLTLLILLLVLFGLAQLVLGTRATPIDTPEALAARLTDGQPTILEFYSNL